MGHWEEERSITSIVVAADKVRDAAHSRIEYFTRRRKDRNEKLILAEIARHEWYVKWFWFLGFRSWDEHRARTSLLSDVWNEYPCCLFNESEATANSLLKMCDNAADGMVRLGIDDHNLLFR